MKDYEAKIKALGNIKYLLEELKVGSEFYLASCDKFEKGSSNFLQLMS